MSIAARVTLTVGALAIVGDCLTTWAVLAHGGAEGNAAMVAIMAHVGPYVGMVIGSAVKAAVGGALVWLTVRVHRGFAVTGLVALVALVYPVIHNLAVLRTLS